MKLINCFMGWDSFFIHFRGIDLGPRLIPPFNQEPQKAPPNNQTSPVSFRKIILMDDQTQNKFLKILQVIQFFVIRQPLILLSII